MRSSFVFTTVILIVAVVGLTKKLSFNGDMSEQELIRRIQTSSGRERQVLIEKLDSVAIDVYPLFDRWFQS